METTRHISEEQITTREFFIKVGNFFSLIFSNWRILLIGLLLGAVFSIVRDILNKKATMYTANLTFNLDIGGSNTQATQLGGLAATLGLPNMGQAAQSGDILSGTNFQAIVTSKVAFERTMMQEVTVNGKKMLMANYYKDSSDIGKTVWGGNIFEEPNTEAIEFKFTKKKPQDFTPLENEIMAAMYEHALPNILLLPQPASTLTTLSVLSTNERLAKTLAENHLKAIEEFYGEIKTQKTRRMLAMQQDRLDSLRGLMLATDRRVAQLTFQNQNVVDPAGPMKQQQVARNNTFYSTQYYTQLATVEQYQRMLLDNMPILTIFDAPRLPLLSTKAGVGQSLMLGSLLGLFISLVFVLIRQAVQSIKANVAEA